MTWGELKKEIDKELEDDAKIEEIKVSERNFKGVEIFLPAYAVDRYTITNKEGKEYIISSLLFR